MMKTSQLQMLAVLLLVNTAMFAQTSDLSDAERKGRELAEETLDEMGGAERWNDTRYLVWENFGQRHYWDKWTGDFRWEDDSLTAILNIHSMEGRFWVDGVEVTNKQELAKRLEQVYARWVNNSYWLIMPYKMLDPGVNLRYMGEDTTKSGQMAEVVEMTFGDVGLTPENKYMVYIDEKTGLVSQWSWWPQRDAQEPNFTRPWTDWKDYNGIMMSTGRGGAGRDIAYLDVPEELPRGIFDGLRY
jgi:hypothetical protein